MRLDWKRDLICERSSFGFRGISDDGVWLLLLESVSPAILSKSNMLKVYGVVALLIESSVRLPCSF